MEFIDSKHWMRKKKYKGDITNEVIEFAIINSPIFRDKYWPDAFNAIAIIPTNGRRLKVIYKRTGKDKLKIITAFWLD